MLNISSWLLNAEKRRQLVLYFSSADRTINWQLAWQQISALDVLETTASMKELFFGLKPLFHMYNYIRKSDWTHVHLHIQPSRLGHIQNSGAHQSQRSSGLPKTALPHLLCWDRCHFSLESSLASIVRVAPRCHLLSICATLAASISPREKFLPLQNLSFPIMV